MGSVSRLLSLISSKPNIMLQDIIPHPSTVSNLFGGLFGRHNSVSDTVVHVKHTVLAVSWLAIDQSVSYTPFSVELLLTSQCSSHRKPLQEQADRNVSGTERIW